MFISLMLLLMAFTAGLFVYAAPALKESQNQECPAGGAACEDDTQAKTADGMIWESFSRHLVSVVQ